MAEISVTVTCPTCGEPITIKVDAERKVVGPEEVKDG
jgi:endogenous inhibitor of DNA gyrase (YacG/DUF329 family)